MTWLYLHNFGWFGLLYLILLFQNVEQTVQKLGTGICAYILRLAVYSGPLNLGKGHGVGIGK